MAADPLDGPEALAAEVKAKSELRPFKIVGQLIGARYEDGEVVGEEVMGDVALYRKQFSEVEEIVERALAQARSQEG